MPQKMDAPGYIYIRNYRHRCDREKYASNRVIPGICGVIFTRSTFGTPALGLRHKLQHPGHLRAVRWTLRYNYNIEAANGNVHTENLCRNMSMNND